MSDRIDRAQPALQFIPPAYNPVVRGIARRVLPLWLKHKTPIARIEAENLDVLVDLYRQFETKQIRLMLAFRHPSFNDPLCLAYLMWHLLPQQARRQGVTLGTTHFHPMYDRGIPLWRGNWFGWLFSKLGGTPIQRGKVDRLGLRSARNLFLDGLFPMAAAPEGATNGHNEIVSPLEPGIAQMSFWCADDLQKAARPERVVLLPVGIQYAYIDPPWQAIERAIAQLETDMGVDPREPPAAIANLEFLQPDRQQLYARLLRLGDRLLSLVEAFYQQFYPRVANTVAAPPTPADPNAALQARTSRLLDVALRVAEEYFDLQPKGTAIERCRRLEQAGWDRIYREDIDDAADLSPIERGLADRVAEEAHLRMWHMRLVENFVAVTGRYVRDKATAERFADTTLILWETVNRIRGGNPFDRPYLGKQRVRISLGEPIDVSDRHAAYQKKRRSAIAELTQDLQDALERAIV